MLIKESIKDRLYLKIVQFFCVMALVITLYPFVYVLSMSISSQEYVLSQTVWLFPRGFSLGAYKLALENPDIWLAYYNTIWYVAFGTLLNVIMTVIAAYPLSRKTFFLRNPLIFIFSFTMFFSGGLIPLVLLVKDIGIYNSRLAMILPVAVSAWYIIIARQFFYSIPESMHESAVIDGAGELRILLRIYLPLSMPIIAVLILFYSVGHWNAYFNALLFLPNQKLQPLQVYLVKILISNSQEGIRHVSGDLIRTAYGIQLKYSIIIITILPILTVYPFLQKYFVKGVMIGALKQ